LDISYNIIGSAGLHSIAQYLTDRDANEFSLKMGPTSRLGMIVFVENLPLMKALTNLEITDASALDEEVWIAFQEGLKQNTSLESLCICEGEDAEGMVSSAVANALQENKHLRQLHITCSQTGVVGAYHLARALQLNSTLRVLNLEHNLLQDAGAITLSQHLVRMKGIEQLSLCENNVGFDGAVALLGGLQHNASLRMFNFGGNPGATKQMMDIINFRLRLNQLGTTELLLTDGTPLALWSLAVENLAKRNWLDVLYHLLGEKPILMKR